MSGEAGASIEGRLYSIFIGSGVNEDIAISPGGDGSEIGEYFDRASRPYLERLERARPRLDALFDSIALPLVPLGGEHEQVDGAIIEPRDEKADHFKQYHRGGSLLLFLDGTLGSYGSLRIRIGVSERVQRRDLDLVVRRVAEILDPLLP